MNIGASVTSKDIAGGNVGSGVITSVGTSVRKYGSRPSSAGVLTMLVVSGLLSIAKKLEILGLVSLESLGSLARILVLLRPFFVSCCPHNAGDIRSGPLSLARIVAQASLASLVLVLKILVQVSLVSLVSLPLAPVSENITCSLFC